MGWVIDFCNTCWFQVFENKNKNQNQRTTGSGYLKNFKEPFNFMKEPAKTQQF
jgi:hypothetical protein